MNISPADSPVRWYDEPAEAACRRLKTDAAAGLTAGEAAERLAGFGPNALRETGRRSLWSMIARQFQDFTTLVLVAAAIIAGIVGDLTDTAVISAIVILNAAIALTQEFRAQKAIIDLRKLAASKAVVLRDGSRQHIDATEVVPGDIVILEAGNIIPADLRLAWVAHLKIAEAALTGESVPVDKHAGVLKSEALSIGDRINMAFKGTTAVHGRGRGIVVATGMRTELGLVAGMLDTAVGSKTPMQHRLGEFGRRLGLIVIGICAVMLVVGLARGEPAGIMFLTAISLAVAAIPEALPATMVVSLALGAKKMAAQMALVHRLPAVEALGSVTYICSDKTGTLTQDRMQVEHVVAPDGSRWPGRTDGTAEPWSSLFTALALNNDVEEGPDGALLGDPTEIAIRNAAAAAGFPPHRAAGDSARAYELPFDSQRKLMTTFHPAEGGYVAYTKGAPESVLGRCTSAAGSMAGAALELRATLDIANGMAAQGLRVLAIAQRFWPQLPSGAAADSVEQGMTLLGFVGLIDPPRREAARSVAACRKAGITPVMITGDHPDTAKAIAATLGILDRGGQVVSGPELGRMSDRELAGRVGQIRVYARVDPGQKIRIVSALQAQGEFVAMTGDGVNDAPALQQANVGVAMGKSGTDVAREAASLVLLDDDFSTIVAAIKEGRRIFDNVRKFIKFLLTGNSAEIWTIFLAPILGLPMPLLPIQILWINLLTDGLPALALSAERAEPDIMVKPPRKPSEGILAGGLWQHVLWVGLLIGGVSLLSQALAIHWGSANWQTMVFTVLVLSQLGHVLAIRSTRISIFSQGLLSNKPVIFAVSVTVILQLAVIYLPALNAIFNTMPLSMPELALCLVLSAIAFLAVEVEKIFVRRGFLYRT